MSVPTYRIQQLLSPAYWSQCHQSVPTYWIQQLLSPAYRSQRYQSVPTYWIQQLSLPAYWSQCHQSVPTYRIQQLLSPAYRSQCHQSVPTYWIQQLSLPAYWSQCHHLQNPAAIITCLQKPVSSVSTYLLSNLSLPAYWQLLSPAYRSQCHQSVLTYWIQQLSLPAYWSQCHQSVPTYWIQQLSLPAYWSQCHQSVPTYWIQQLSSPAYWSQHWESAASWSQYHVSTCFLKPAAIIANLCVAFSSHVKGEGSNELFSTCFFLLLLPLLWRLLAQAHRFHSFCFRPRIRLQWHRVPRQLDECSLTSCMWAPAGFLDGSHTSLNSIVSPLPLC